jgi:DNA-binding transcriptional regulator YhcF (GntR family)
VAGPRETVKARGASVPSVAEPGLFSRVSMSRIPEIIVEQIRLLMRQGQLKPGDRLPTERDPCERFGVSRTTVREALRILESSGLVEIRPRAHGGVFVTAPSCENAHRENALGRQWGAGRVGWMNFLRSETRPVTRALFAQLFEIRCYAAPPAGFEPALTAPEAVALSPELWGPGNDAHSHRPPNGRSNLTSSKHPPETQPNCTRATA